MNKIPPGVNPQAYSLATTALRQVEQSLKGETESRKASAQVDQHQLEFMNANGVLPGDIHGFEWTGSMVSDTMRAVQSALKGNDLKGALHFVQVGLDALTNPDNLSYGRSVPAEIYNASKKFDY